MAMRATRYAPHGRCRSLSPRHWSGIAISEGYIKSLDDPITNYLPELKDQGFDRDHDQKSPDYGIWNSIQDRFLPMGRICAGWLLP